jgi:hypothetical protein
VPNGRAGDNPITDALDHAVFGPEVDALLREIFVLNGKTWFLHEHDGIDDDTDVFEAYALGDEESFHQLIFEDAHRSPAALAELRNRLLVVRDALLDRRKR